jgi:hypothetical protein
MIPLPFTLSSVVAILALLVCSFVSKGQSGQPAIEIGVVHASPGDTSVCVELKVHGFDPIVGFQFSINYDDEYLTFTKIMNYNPNLPEFDSSNINSPYSGVVLTAWVGYNGFDGHDMPNGDLWAEICFDVSPHAVGLLEVTASSTPIIMEIIRPDGVFHNVGVTSGGVLIVNPPTEFAFGSIQTYTVCPEEDVLLCPDVSSFYTPSLKYDWLDENGNTVASDSCLRFISIDADAYGSYHCRVSDTNVPDVVYISEAFIITEQLDCLVLDASEETDLLAELSVFPNPVQGEAQFVFHLASSQAITLLVTDVTGRICHQWSGTLPMGKQTLTWDAGNMPSGMYFYQLRSERQSSQGSLILAR